jgi:hypothetical protein
MGVPAFCALSAAGQAATTAAMTGSQLALDCNIESSALGEWSEQ